MLINAGTENLSYLVSFHFIFIGHKNEKHKRTATKERTANKRRQAAINEALSAAFPNEHRTQWTERRKWHLNLSKGQR